MDMSKPFNELTPEEQKERREFIFKLRSSDPNPAGLADDEDDYEDDEDGDEDVEYVDAGSKSHDGLFIVRKPEKSFGVVDKDGNIIIDFDWFGIERMECGDMWSAFVTYTDCKDGIGSIYSLYSRSGHLIVGGLDETPDRDVPHSSLDAYYEKIDKLDSEAAYRYIVVRRGGMLGAVADGRLLHEPTLVWRDLWSVIQKDWRRIKKHWKANERAVDERNGHIRRKYGENTANKSDEKINLDQDPSSEFADVTHHWSIMEQREFFNENMDEDLNKTRELFKALYGYSPSV